MMTSSQTTCPRTASMARSRIKSQSVQTHAEPLPGQACLTKALKPGLFLTVAFALKLLSLFPGDAMAANRFAAPGQDRPNFLFLFSDDQTHRALGLLGELE